MGEHELYTKIRENILDSFSDIKELSSKTANLDMLASLSKVAYNNNYIRPVIKDKYTLKIE